MTRDEKRTTHGSETFDLETCTTRCPPKIAFSPYSQEDSERMGGKLRAAFLIAETHRFDYLLTAIDVADEDMGRTLVQVSAIR